MKYFGEIAALGVSVSWAMSALFFEQAGKRIGSVTVNLYKVIITALLIGLILLFVTGVPYPLYASGEAWSWLLLSGLVGFVICDLCLFYAYVTITSRFSQLIMTLYPPVTALSGWLILDEKMPTLGYLGMTVTLIGVAISIFKKDPEKGRIKLNIPMKGFICAIIGAITQGLGLVLSKQGMIYYAQNPDMSEEVRAMIPFASTQIRAIIGIIGFFLIMWLSGRLHLVKESKSDFKGLKYTILGSIFGPFIGVSLSLLAVQSASTGVVATIMATTPLVILIPHVFIFKKKVTRIEILGAIISVVGVSLFFL